MLQAKQPISRNLEVEALREAARWPNASPVVVFALQRVHHQRTGYWKADGDGIEVFAAAEWAAALDLLGGSTVDAFVRTATDLLGRGDVALALQFVDYGLVSYADDETLRGLRKRALYRLMERYQLTHPFKFVVYSGWAGAKVPPAQ